MPTINAKRITLDDLVPPDLVFEADGTEFKIQGKSLTVEAVAELSKLLKDLQNETDVPFAGLQKAREFLQKLAGTELPPLSVAQTLKILETIMREGSGFSLPPATTPESSSSDSSSSARPASASRTKK